jgi:transcriptional regulator with XRE-family HTH domain
VKLLSEIFAKRLKEERENKHWTQGYFASLLGVSNGTISGYERNYREPDINTLIKISELLDVSIDYLTGKTNKRDNLELNDNIPNDDFLADFNSLPKEHQKMIKTMIRVYKEEQESDDDNTKNNVDFLR